MPDVKEVYDMVTQQAPPEPDALERQRKRQMRRRMNRKLGGFAAAAAIAGVVLVVVLFTREDGGRKPATSTNTEPSVAVPVAPKPDFLLNLDTGEAAPLPQAIIRSLGSLGPTGRLGCVAHHRRNCFPQYAASPGGSLLAYVGTGDAGTRQIFIAGIDGTGVRQVTNDPTGATSPAWSPDGTRIAYQGYGSGDVRNLFVLDLDTGESTQVIFGDRDLWEGTQFTPDGSSLLYCRGSNSYPVLWIVPVAGGKSTVLFGRGRGGMADACGGSLSPDGSLVTMMGSEIGGPGAIRFVANADRTQLRHIPGGSSNPAGTWSPDGSRIVCSNFAEDRIMVVDIATGDATTVAKGSEAIWLDDHTLLVEA